MNSISPRHFLYSGRDSSRERWIYLHLYYCPRNEENDQDVSSLDAWVLCAALPCWDAPSCVLIPGPFASWNRPWSILCGGLLILEIPSFGWSKLVRPDPTPGSGGRHICSVWLPANRGFTLQWVGEKDFYVGRGFIVGWWGVARMKGGNHFSSLAGLSDFLCSRV